MVEVEVRVVKKDYKFRDDDAGTTIYITIDDGCVSAITIYDTDTATKRLTKTDGIGIPIRHLMRLAVALQQVYEREMKKNENH